MRLKYVLLLTSLLWGGLLSPLSAATPSRVRSLTGIPALHVLVEDFNAATQKIGLQKNQLQTLAETYLIQHGVKVSHDEHSVPAVYIRLSAVVGSDHSHAPISFYLTVEVKQFAHLAPASGAVPTAVSTEPPLLVSTWEDGTMAMLDRSELEFYVNQILTNLLDELVQEYQDANQ